ncbi:hypothetical protein ES705_44080 [subsurface metagenome]
MSEVVRYSNTKLTCYCQIKLDSGERILISIATAPKPCVKVIKLIWHGMLPIQTIWEYNPTMAGGYDAYVRNMMQMFLSTEPKHPLDILRDQLLPCKSISEVQQYLLDAESGIRKNETVAEAYVEGMRRELEKCLKKQSPTFQEWLTFNGNSKLERTDAIVAYLDYLEKFE